MREALQNAKRFKKGATRPLAGRGKPEARRPRPETGALGRSGPGISEAKRFCEKSQPSREVPGHTGIPWRRLHRPAGTGELTRPERLDSRKAAAG